MKNRNIWILSAGLMNLFVALLHTFGGQISLIDPLLASAIQPLAKAELLGVWHMITLLLFATSFVLIWAGWRNRGNVSKQVLVYIAYGYALVSLPSLVLSLYYQFLVPQWILLLPIGLLCLTGLKNSVSAS